MSDDEPALAYTPAPAFSYTKPTPDGQHLLVMLTLEPRGVELSRGTPSEAQRIQNIRDTYPQSGLYLNDGSSTPLWTVNWYALRQSAMPLSDGVHLVVVSEWADQPDGRAVAFFAKGKLIRSYTVGDLSAGDWTFPRSQLNDNDKTITIKQNGKRYTFDVATGEILLSSFPTRWLPAVALILVVGILIIFVGAFGFRRRGQKKLR